LTTEDLLYIRHNFLLYANYFFFNFLLIRLIEESSERDVSIPSQKVIKNSQLEQYNSLHL